MIYAIKYIIMTDRNLLMANNIAQKIKEFGGRAYFVGGYVRDSVMGLANKDIDIEIHGVEINSLAKILDSLGEVMRMGASFEIFKLRHYDLDIALPLDIYGGERKAALRRDFTVNALMQDILTGEILDFFGGLDDIDSRIIKQVSSKSFQDDPLRVLRAARFAACLDFKIDDETKKFASRVSLDSLASERVFNEIERALLKAVRPSIFFESLREMWQINYWLSELENVKDFELLATVAKIRENASEKLYFMMSALCLEIDECENFLTRLTSEDKLIKYVLNMRDLTEKIKLADNENDYMKIFDESICPNDLLLISRLLVNESKYNELENFLELYNSRMNEPYLMGRDLIESGVKPGALMGDALKFAHKLRLAGINKDGQLIQTLKFIREKAEKFND